MSAPCPKWTPPKPYKGANSTMGIIVVLVVCACALAYVAYLMHHNPSILATWDE